MYPSSIRGLKKELCERFDMSDLGDIKNLLGIEIDRLPDGSFFLHQGRYIGNLLAKHQMEGCKPVATPMASKITGPMDEVDQTGDGNGVIPRIGRAEVVRRLKLRMARCDGGQCCGREIVQQASEEVGGGLAA